MERILIAGSSGMIGTSVIRALQQKQISTISLHREKSGPSPAGNHSVAFWDPYAAQALADPQAIAGVTGAIHLSGANLSGHRWTRDYKQEILDSRVKSTHALALALAGLQPKPSVFVCASAIGIYGGRGDELLSENSAPGTGFLPEVCLAWEKATQPAADAGIRVVHARFGVVLSPAGGALKQMLTIFRLGLGGPLGSGQQWMSWIALPDATRALLFALGAEGLSGPINIVAPEAVTNAAFSRMLGRVLHRPALLPAPALALRLAFGEMADATILESERVLPARLQSAGFTFDSPGLESALTTLLAT